MHDQTLDSLEAMGYRNFKELNGRLYCIYSFAFTDAIILLCRKPMDGYDDRWCFEPGKADLALEKFDGTGEPEGWHRHPRSGRRRENGDPATEYINP